MGTNRKGLDSLFQTTVITALKFKQLKQEMHSRIPRSSHGLKHHELSDLELLQKRAFSQFFIPTLTIVSLLEREPNVVVRSCHGAFELRNTIEIRKNSFLLQKFEVVRQWFYMPWFGRESGSRSGLLNKQEVFIS
jgi:hypothetical protein